MWVNPEVMESTGRNVLLSRSMLSGEMYAKIHAARTSQEKMRELFRALHAGGEQVKFAFYSALRVHDPHLLQDLESDCAIGEDCDSLGGCHTSMDDDSPIIQEYKESIRSKYKTVEEYNSLPGEHVLLDDRYTDLLIVQTHRGQSEREEEIRSRGERFHDVLSSRASEMYHSIIVDQLFAPDGHGDSPKAVILQGNSGHGKSFTVQKIMCDWASGNLFREFDFVFHLNCKELNHSFGLKSVRDLLNCNQRCTAAVSQTLQHSPQKVLFLVDGFDELKFPLEGTSTSPSNDPFTQAPVDATLRALLKGHVLAESSLLVTTRSTAADRLNKLLKRPQRFTEILGFSEDGVKEYFQRFFNDEQLSGKVYEYVRANETLFTACFIPVICWIVCTVFREQLKTDMEVAREIETTTSIFVHFVFTLLEHHCQGLSQPVPNLLRNLGQLAEKGMLEQQVLFDERTVSEAVSEPTSVPFLCKFLLKRKISLRTMFSFMHLSFQEFFAALLYLLVHKEEPHKITRFLSAQGQDLTKSHLLPVVQFLYGLSNKEVATSLLETLDISASSFRAQLEELTPGFIQQVRSSYQMAGKDIFILHCLYELHEADFVKRAMDRMKRIELFSIPLKRTDCWVMMYCLQCCPVVRSLSITQCNLTADKLKMLQFALCRCEELRLQVSSLSDLDICDLLSVLGKAKIQKELSIKVDNLKDANGKTLSSALSVRKQTSTIRVTVEQNSTKTQDDVTQESNLLGQPAFTHMSLVLSHSSGTFNLSWKDIFQKLHAVNKNLGFDEHVALLLSFLRSVADLKRLFLRVSCLTMSWATGILSLIQTCPSLEYTGVEMDDQKDGGLSLCSSLSAGKDKSSFRLTIEHRQMQQGQKNHWTEPTVSSISLYQSYGSETPDTSWKDFLQLSYALKAPHESVDPLFSSLPTISGLNRLEMRLKALTVHWAAGIFSLIQTCPSLEYMSFTVDGPGENDGKNLCCFLCLEKQISTFTLTVEDSSLVAISRVSLTFLGSSEVFNINWMDFFQGFEKLKRFTKELDEHLDVLFSFLHSVCELRRVELKVGCLTESWADRILSLIQACVTLEEVKLMVGRYSTLEGLLLETVLKKLQEAKKRSDCTLILDGRRCSKPTDLCSECGQCGLDCSRPVEIQIKGESFQETLL
ncbi:NACHT, LRR and PYD domains-containing protein 6-like isoform X2 [Denticeps clupeoides]|uniref:NACHT, LRR and PYD domains-containing protein 6-like isoform X2 n=1 Tax=Denticeps clupeoides TaxID=299321 RepID=UPI0010A47363|nr:NACHT, LRR and PYD domains-containing protein 6-like isoform X2 [Denticeps clupeoides]